MKDTGPEAVPPPANCSFEERSFERFTPEPEPPLKITPSLRYQSRIESIVSLTDRMKHAEHCGFGSTPHVEIVLTTRPMSWRTLRSRCGVPSCPRKYFDTTTLVASCDHDFGTSTPRCS